MGYFGLAEKGLRHRERKKYHTTQVVLLWYIGLCNVRLLSNKDYTVSVQVHFSVRVAYKDKTKTSEHACRNHTVLPKNKILYFCWFCLKVGPNIPLLCSPYSGRVKFRDFFRVLLYYIVGIADR